VKDSGVEKTRASEYVALLPAAGTGSRLPDRLLSKELLPYGGANGDGSPVISHILSCLHQAGVREVIVVIRKGKSDIPDYLSGGEWEQTRFSYKITPGTSGVPETVALGLQDACGRRVAFGFPDILFKPKGAFVKLMRRLETSEADVVLGLFPTNNPSKFDMVNTDDNGRVTDIEIKPQSTPLELTWILAAWEPSFSTYLKALTQGSPGRLEALARESGGSHLGHAFQLAMADGLLIESESFTEGRSLDIGTPDDLALARAWTY